MRLEDIANVIAGQIMTRVTDENNEGESVQVLVPKAIADGIIVKEDLGKAVLSKSVDEDKYTKEGDVVIKLSTPYDAAYVTAEDAGIVIPSFCATIRITKENLMDAKYLSAFLNTSYVRNQLTAKVVGSTRPMIKITDVRALEIPKVSMQDMRDIGEAYMLSGMKKATLLEMIATESKLMENIVLASIKEGMSNE
ncbi:MAG: hypothetical protein U0L79_09690 [Lachnospiraceae bacterium]|nr:hypothetical protein [Lachnospiraceae bacterium]